MRVMLCRNFEGVAKPLGYFVHANLPGLSEQACESMTSDMGRIFETTFAHMGAPRTANTDAVLVGTRLIGSEDKTGLGGHSVFEKEIAKCIGERDSAVSLVLRDERVGLLDHHKPAAARDGEPVPSRFADLVQTHSSVEGAKQHKFEVEVITGGGNDRVPVLFRGEDGSGRLADAGIFNFGRGVVEAAARLLCPGEKRTDSAHASFSRGVGEVRSHVGVKQLDFLFGDLGARLVADKLAKRGQGLFKPAGAALGMLAHGSLLCEERSDLCVEVGSQFQRAAGLDEGDSLHRDCWVIGLEGDLLANAVFLGSEPVNISTLDDSRCDGLRHGSVVHGVYHSHKIKQTLTAVIRGKIKNLQNKLSEVFSKPKSGASAISPLAPREIRRL